MKKLIIAFISLFIILEAEEEQKPLSELQREKLDALWLLAIF